MLGFDFDAARIWDSDAQLRQHPRQEDRPTPIRIPGRGTLVARFFLPLALAQPRNRSRGARQPWQSKVERDAVLAAMRSQMHFWGPPNWVVPFLGDRPLVRCIRYSSHEPDATAGWSKVPVDCLQPPGERTTTKRVTHPLGHAVSMSRKVKYGGLGIIASDAPAACEVVEWWEPCPRGKGFAVIEVWTG